MKKLLVVLMMCLVVAAAQAIYVENYSFEDPAGVKCKNWDGETTYPDVPGWTDGGAVSADSGLEAWSGTSDGLNRGFLMGNLQGAGDPGVYQVTSYAIVAGETYRLTVDLRNDWNAPTHQLGLYYTADGGATLVELVMETVDITGEWAAYTAQYTVGAADAAIGNNLVIKLNNNGAGWSNMDNVRLDLVPEPATLSLLGLGTMTLLRKRK
jgi:hypothetical protein